MGCNVGCNVKMDCNVKMVCFFVNLILTKTFLKILNFLVKKKGRERKKSKKKLRSAQSYHLD